MPRTTLPPTPAASGDIAGKDDPAACAVDKSFNLPPPALHQGRVHASTANPKPIQPAAAPNFSLPPPPTRSRTIIQVKPRPPPNDAPEKRPSSSGSKASAKKTASNSAATTKKQPNASSAAGKKIARKTAHSVIERRRRSKMNEEFAVLKGMIPACTDQEMHKLAILQVRRSSTHAKQGAQLTWLQAGIDYLRYLENCVKELKAANQTLSTPLLQAQQPPGPRSQTSAPPLGDDGQSETDDTDEEKDRGDVVMEDASSTDMTSAFSVMPSASTPLQTSPQTIALSPSFGAPRPSQASSYDSLSSLPSPTSNGAAHHQFPLLGRTLPSHRGSDSSSGSGLPQSTSTSPTIHPNCHKDHDQDREATAALLMLNQDRRGTRTASNVKGGRGMSVKDLLSC